MFFRDASGNKIFGQWTAPTGETVGNVANATGAQRLAWGVVQVDEVYPVGAGTTYTESAVVNGVCTRTYIVDIALAQNAIDAAAEAVRKKYCPYDLQHKEYEASYADACAWLGNQAAAVPQTVTDGINASYPTALASATLIKATGDAYLGILAVIRTTRLQGKYAVLAGTKTTEQVLAELGAL